MLAFYKKLLGHPFVYDRVRPAVVGGIDMVRLYELLAGAASRVVLDVGCGTGDALNHLSGFDQYVGVDTDPVAIEHARTRFGSRPGVSFECRELRASDVADLAPTGVVLSGVLHHLSNAEAEGVLRLVCGSPRLVRVATSDIVFLPGETFNNVLAMLDRGRYCRDPDAYAAVARRAGLEVEKAMTVPSAPGAKRVSYWIMSLAPKGRAA
ncbi:MAG TPA: class I SAM-dependent methyltransferase [Labilithrix sp.]